MSFNNGEQFWSFVGRDHFLPNFDLEAVSAAMDGFPLKLCAGRDIEWLTVASRRALAILMRHVSDGPDRKSNAEVKAEIEELSQTLRETWLRLFELDHLAEDQIWRYAWRVWDGEGGEDVGDGRIMGTPTLQRRFSEAKTELDWLSGFLARVSKEVTTQKTKWRSTETKSIRIERAQYLALIFEAAFGEQISANNWPSGKEQEKTPFMDFYQRMVGLAYGEHCTPDLSGVIKEACKRHRVFPAKFADGVIPGL